jgi:hypothetical protein
MVGGFTGTLIKGATLGLGAVAARLAANGVNYYLIKGGDKGTGTPLTDVSKVALEAGVGVGGWFLLKKMGQASLANSFLIGAGIAVALDVYDLYIKDSIVKSLPGLADYSYGSLQGWAPQAGIAGWAPQTGLSAYSTGTLQGDGDAYANGAFD